jgi:hypothetical protein
MRRPASAVPAALALILALGSSPSRAAAQDALPPPPPPPADDVPLPPPPPGTHEIPRGDAAPAATSPAPAPAPAPAPGRAPSAPGTIGEAPFVAAGSQAAPLHPDEAVSHWALALATGVAGRFGGYQISSKSENRSVMLYLGGQADGLWSEGRGRAARLRLRMFTGGESQVFVPSDGDVEAAYMIGRREFRFVIARAEVNRAPGLALEALVQAATLPSVEGSVPLLGDTMRLYYYVSPVEAAWVRYYGGAHLDPSAEGPSEDDRVTASTSARLRWTLVLPPSMILSLQGDLVKMWGQPDVLLSGEGSLGIQVLDKTVVFDAVIRWDSYKRRLAEPDASDTETEMKLMALATLVF